MAPPTLSFFGCALLGMVQLSNSLTITKIVHQSCPATTSTTLPNCGWISTSGSSVPYCFTTPTQSLTTPSTRSPPVISVTVTPLPSIIVSTQSAPTATGTTSILPPIYTPPIIGVPTTTTTIITTTTATATTLRTVAFPPGYNGVSSSSSTITTLTTVGGNGEAPGYNGQATTTITTTLSTVSLPPGYNVASALSSTITTLTTIGGNPGVPDYNGQTTTTTTSNTFVPPPGYAGSTTPSASVPTVSNLIPTDLPLYCYQNGALLNVGVNVTITDNLDQVYALSCVSSQLALGVGLSGTDLATVDAPNSVDDCLAACDADADCSGFTFESDDTGTWGVGPGTCYLYSGFGLAFTAAEQLQLIAFIKLDALTRLPLRKRVVGGGGKSA